MIKLLSGSLLFFGHAGVDVKSLSGSWWLDVLFLLFVMLAFAIISWVVKVRVCVLSVLLPGVLLMGGALIAAQVFLGHIWYFELSAVILTGLLLVIPLTRKLLKTTLFRAFLVWLFTMSAVVFGLNYIRVHRLSHKHTGYESKLDRSSDAIRKALTPKGK